MALDIRNIRNPDIKVEDVERDDRRSVYIVRKTDMWEVYPYDKWEPADIEQWASVSPVVANEGRTLRVGSAHVAGILNTSYRFGAVDAAGKVIIEQRIA